MKDGGRFDKKKYNKKYRETHGQQIKEHSKRYYKTHKQEFKEYAEQYGKIHREEIKKQKKQYHKTHKREAKEYSKIYIKAHEQEIKEYKKKYMKQYTKIYEHKLREYKKQYRKTHIEDCRRSHKIWKENNPIKCKLYRQQRAALRKSAGELTIKTIQMVYEDNIKKFGTLTCYLCLKPIEFGKDHLEHKNPISRGGTNARENLDVACQHCNCSKHIKTEIEFREWLVNTGGVNVY